MSWFLPYFAVHVPQTSVQVWHFCLNLCQPAPYYTTGSLFNPNVAQWSTTTFAELRVLRRCLHFLCLYSSPACLLWSCPCACLPAASSWVGASRWIARNGLLAHSWFRHHFHMDILGQSRGWIEAGRSSGVWKTFIIKEKKQALRQYEIHKWTRMQRAEAVQECKHTC